MARAMKTRVAKHKAARLGTATESRRAQTGWTLRRVRGIQVLESRALSKLRWLVHGFSTRCGGESVLDGKRVLNLGFTDWDDRDQVIANRKKFTGVLGAQRMRSVTLRQMHSDMIYLASDSSAKGRGAPPSNAKSAAAPQADALITRTCGLLLGVQTADCVPILLADTRHRAVVAIHAGWRGTLARVAAKTIGRMRMEFGTRPRDIVAAIGPSIGRCCYQVGPEVAQGFASQFSSAVEWFDGPFDQLAHGEEPLWLPWLTMMPPGHVPPPPRVQLDLRAANRWQLLDAGIPDAQMDISDLCTACSGELFFSYRRESAKTGRMMAAIGMPGRA